MQPLVTIAITQYRETEAQLATLLHSLNNQVQFDFSQLEVLIVGDGGIKIDQDIFYQLSQLPHPTYIYHDKSRGAGPSRQHLMDLARGQYIMYLDGDDVLQDVEVLNDFAKIALEQSYDIIWGQYQEWFKPNADGFQNQKIREFNNAVVYGKWLNLSFLRKYLLRWHPELKNTYEDAFFMNWVHVLARSIRKIERPVYNWLYHENSLIRSVKSTADGDNIALEMPVYVKKDRFWLQESRLRFPENLPFDLINAWTAEFIRWYDHREGMSVSTYQAIVNEARKISEENADVLPSDDTEYLQLVQDKLSWLEKPYSATELMQSAEKYFRDLTRHISSRVIQPVVPIFPAVRPKLSIVIPQYKESETTIAWVLHSISNQIQFDLSSIEVIIVGDHGYHLQKSNFFDRFAPLSIRYIYKATNEGAGLARQTGLDAATGQYIMFIDADDILYSAEALAYFNCYADGGNQIIEGKLINSYAPDENGNSKLNWERYLLGSSCVKWYLTDDLRRTKLRFNLNLHGMYEDGYFAGQANRVLEKVVRFDELVYIWKDNPESQTRGSTRLPDIYITQYSLQNREWFRETRQRFPQLLEADVNNFSIQMYYMLELYHSKNSEEALKQMKENLVAIVSENGDIWRGWSPELQVQCARKTDGDAIGQSADNFHKFINTYMTVAQAKNTKD